MNSLRICSSPRFMLRWGLAVVLGMACLPAGVQAAELQAKWIWKDQENQNPYNQTILAKKTFRLDSVQRGELAITADSFYRLFVNGQWVNDGPCRAWAEHFQYDVIDVTPYLRAGENEISVIARYFGVGDFHRVPKQAGLLAQLDVTLANGQKTTVISDGTWETADATAWLSTTPKVSIQMEPAEWYDARLEEPRHPTKTQELFAANGGPWKGLHPRDCELLTRKPFPLASFAGAKLVKCEGFDFCLPAARLVHPGLIEANNHVSAALGMATVVECAKEASFDLRVIQMAVAVDGKTLKPGKCTLTPGRHLVLALANPVFGHRKERSLRMIQPEGLVLRNPRDPSHANPWCLVRFPDLVCAKTDLLWMPFGKEDPEIARVATGYAAVMSKLLSTVKTPEDFNTQLGAQAELLPAEKMFVSDSSWQFQERKVVGDATALVRDPSALIQRSGKGTVVQPSREGDVELCYDLGQQNIGYYSFELVAKAGVAVDIFGVEYITPDGRIQHTGDNRNGLRYITREGVNRFTSLKRRSGRYLFVTLRQQDAPVEIRDLHLVESTYPVRPVASFHCSDPRLDKIWEISTRTLKLCMEDTYTDCPLYEQTHWVGDARNESLYGYNTFGAIDLGARCIRITAQSMERYPFTGCQTPSCWDCLLPAWSFLWGISVWDYYWATGDKELPREVWPAVIANLRGAEKYLDERGLFSGPFWNLLDWTPIDQGQKAVLHNSMLMVGAIDAALRTADVVGDTSQNAWLKALRARLVSGVNKLWDEKRGAYPDAIRGDGKISPSTCQHTSFLSILYDILEPAHLEAAKKNLLDPPQGMVRVGSPFAMQYMYETLEKLGLEDQIIRDIYRNYSPMVEAGETTVWESFPASGIGGTGFPTRSHCHAWSSAPSYFLGRIVLGIKTTSPAAATVQISPHLGELTWAKGTVATVRGPVSVSWKRQGETLVVDYEAPEGVQVAFVRNPSLHVKEVRLQGTRTSK